MRFAYQGREFATQPSVEGPMAHFTIGERSWARRVLKIVSIDDLDGPETMMLAFFLQIRREDHTLIPPSAWEKLTQADFELIMHPVPALDTSGNCAECNLAVGTRIHVEPEDGTAPDPTGPTPETTSTT
jgi:hypothetical protein